MILALTGGEPGRFQTLWAARTASKPHPRGPRPGLDTHFAISYPILCPEDEKAAKSEDDAAAAIAAGNQILMFLKS
jgi:hypothetical protein